MLFKQRQWGMVPKVQVLMVMFIGLLATTVTAAEKVSNVSEVVVALQKQVQVVEKQLMALTMRRREDYQLLEDHLKQFVLDNSRQFSEIDVQKELRSLREELGRLRDNPMGQNGDKERVTVKWASQAIAELRKEMAEVQQISSDSSRESIQRTMVHEEVLEMREHMKKMRLELESLSSRQEATEQQMAELQTEVQESMEDLRANQNRFAENQSATNSTTSLHQNQNSMPTTIDLIPAPAAADHHRMRHQRLFRQQMQRLDRAQQQLRHEVRLLKGHRLESRVESLEAEQRRLANSNFNLSRGLSGVDRMHSSVLELFEALEGTQTKVDQLMPDVRREISKLEFDFAQLKSQQELMREESHNRAKSIQAIAVSVSALQGATIRPVVPSSSTGSEKNSTTDFSESTYNSSNGKNTSPRSEMDQSKATVLVERLERIESEYEKIVNKLPKDCSQVHAEGQEAKDEGFFLIATPGQEHPMMARCQGEWTTVQQRHDGSVDFNRSWEEYSVGFGSPTSEFWLGNEKLHHLTQDNCSRLRVEMQDIYDNFWYAEYGFFKVEARASGYRLIISEYQGNASDALDYQNHMEFSAVDTDRDISNTNCAANYEGGWWFSHCQHANLNGRYNLGLTWFDATRNEWIAVKSSRMLVGKDQVCLQEFAMMRR